MDGSMKRAPRLYTHWRRPSRSRNQRLAFFAVMLALAGLALWLLGDVAHDRWPDRWP